VRHELQRGERLRQLGVDAGKSGHELGPWLRQDGESVTFCTRCDAHVYVRSSEEWIVDESGLSQRSRAPPADPTNPISTAHRAHGNSRSA